MNTAVKSIQQLLDSSTEDSMVRTLVHDYTSMKNARASWEAEIDELITYLDATDTRTTTNSKLPFKNSTTINKISQIRQNIVTAYMEHLLPNRKWVQWQALTEDDNAKDKREAIENYVRFKAEKSGLEGVLEQLADDYTVFGITVTHTRHITRTQTDVNGNPSLLYTGAVAQRINPMDFVFDVTAPDIKSARKCIRSVYTLGGLRQMVGEDSDSLITEEQFQKIRDFRTQIKGIISDSSTGKRSYNALIKAGFGDVLSYVMDNTVEILTFYGDFYDEESDTLLNNHEIVVVNRQFIAKKQSIDTWSGSQNLHVALWDTRGDSLAPMGPLSRIVGLQYKVDKLENLRADIFDKIADPATVEIGDVRRHGKMGAPGFRYEVDEGGDVKYLTPPTQALNADLQIQNTLALMEDLSGAPREAIGQRTPGEKTKFEVQLLDQGQSKLFRRKVKQFERDLLTPVITDYLEMGRKNIDSSDVISVFNDSLGSESFLNVTQTDLSGQGTLVARGATLFAEKANALQNLLSISNSNLYANTRQHWSSIKLARTIESLADLEDFDLITENIGVQEQNKTARLANTAQNTTEEVALTEGNITDEVDGI